MPVFAPLGPGDPLLIGGYRLLARIDERAFLAATQSGRRLAITLVPADDRFRTQAAAAQRVRSPFAAHVLDAHADRTRPWMATAHVPGPSLSTAVTKLGPLPPELVRPIMAGAAQAVEASRSAGVTQAGPTPANLILAPDGPRVVAPGICLTGTNSPEEALGHDVTPATDVYSLGALALHGTDLENAPPDLRRLIERCLNPNPAKRPSLEDVLAELSPDQEPPGEGWLPARLAALLPPYAADPTHANTPLPQAAPPPAAARPPMAPPVDARPDVDVRPARNTQPDGTPRPAMDARPDDPHTPTPPRPPANEGPGGDARPPAHHRPPVDARPDDPQAPSAPQPPAGARPRGGSGWTTGDVLLVGRAAVTRPEFEVPR
ncbi:hypothetical protein J4573_46360 [Actinomadura barringtoniae]|uniref:Protein kinase domain-containing protein n=1 Tax=Actinomadura barringtoniae TaxID=1427535 RepID=A0A939T669_9ACTN|nr:hypothetical protein [Actinomadura barringtoniae]MBO2454581.1 hypothetical protein [Actinomadura barringtoniae]